MAPLLTAIPSSPSFLPPHPQDGTLALPDRTGDRAIALPNPNGHRANAGMDKGDGALGADGEIAHFIRDKGAETHALPAPPSTQVPIPTSYSGTCISLPHDGIIPRGWDN